MTFKNYFKGYKLIYSEKAKKSLDKFDKKTASKICEKVDQLLEGKDGLDVKKLKAYKEDTYRLRVGSIRILFLVWKNELIVYIIDVDHRKDIYE